MKFNVADWNGFDWLLAGILLLSTARAFFRGLVRTLFGLIGVIAGFETATWNYVAFGDWIHGRQIITSLPGARFAAFLVLACAIFILVQLAGSAARKTAHAVGLGFFDRLLGAVFGFIRGVLLGVAAIVAVTTFLPDAAWLRGSKLSSYFLAAAHAVSFVVPHSLR